jgi:hypothetical protein
MIFLPKPGVGYESILGSLVNDDARMYSFMRLDFIGSHHRGSKYRPFSIKPNMRVANSHGELAPVSTGHLGISMEA